MSNDNNGPISLAPSEILGVIQRLLRELDAYLNQPPLAVDAAMCAEHLNRIQGFLHQFGVMQAAMRQAVETGKSREMRN